MRLRYFLFKTLALALLFLVAFWGYLAYRVTERFEERKWNLPSRIFSDSFPLYAGMPLIAASLDEKLSHLNYLAVPGVPKRAGEFRKKGGAYEIFLHDFDYPHEKFRAALVKLALADGRVASLLDADGKPLTVVNLEPELIASVFDENMEDRTVVTLDQVPGHLVDAVIAIEDERFFSHFGVDPVGIVRAMLANLRAMRVVQGGSTLTQQLVKNFFLHHRKTLNRKFNELFMAVSMEIRYTKSEILEAYLNEIYFGQRGPASISGVQEAARHYFSKNVGELLPAESALLAALIRSPGQYSPFRNPDACKQRRDLVLARLKEAGKLSESEYAEAVKTPLPEKRERDPGNAAHFVEFVKKQLRDDFPQTVLSSYGLRVFTTLDMGWQRTAESALRKNLDRMEKDYPKLRGNAAKGLRLQGALLALQPGTGFIRAYVAGRDFETGQFDHLSQARRQPGSTFKPFVYLAALMSSAPSFTLASILEDEPFTFDEDGVSWQPHNYDRSFHGKIRFREALEKSYNVATAWLGNQIGFERVVAAARKAGIGSDLKPYPSLVLGAFEVTPLELALAYAVFPNQGVRVAPVAVRRVVTPEGAVLEKKSVTLERAFEADVVYLMNKALSGVIDSGTGSGARKMGFKAPAAGKTGTTTNTRDAWFVGFTPEILALAWTGYDDNTPTGLTGASGALPVWTEFMRTAVAGQNQQDFAPTPNIVMVTVDRRTGLLYDETCAAPLSEYFIEGTEPFEYCDQVFEEESPDAESPAPL